MLLVAKKEAQARYLCDKIIQSLLDFHQGEFGPWIAPPIVDEFRTIKVERGLFGPRSQSEWQTRMTQLELELGIRPVKRNQIVLVFHRPPFEGCVFRGFAHKSHRIFHIWTSESRFVDKVAVHEFYHACLQLEHSHGLDAPDDPRCLMTQGERALKTCYLHPFHKACCLTPRTVQRKIHKSLRAVESGRWNETVATLTDAFAEDPLHHWLARQLAAVLFRVNRFKEASEVLRRHFKYSPTREAKAVLLDALAFTGNISEAKKLQQKWPRGGSPMEETMALLIAWKGAGYYRFALKVAEENLSRCGYSSGLYFEIGDLRWRMQQRRAAEQAFLETIRRGHTRVYNCLSLIKSELGDHVQARAYFELGRAEFFDEQACYLEMRLALAQGLWDEAKVQIEQVGGKPEWARGYKVVLCYLEDGSESPALKELETFGLSLEWGWFAMVWRSFLNGEPDVGLLKSGYRLFGLNPCWNLARYLVMGIEIPPHYFHQTIRDRIRGERT